MPILKVCEKCGKIKGSQNRSIDEVCKYCGGKMLVKGEQRSMSKQWQSPRQ